MKKKFLLILSSMLVSIGVLVGCSGDAEIPQDNEMLNENSEADIDLDTGDGEVSIDGEADEYDGDDEFDNETDSFDDEFDDEELDEEEDDE